MAGYTRQSVADIINGADITAPPVNAEFNQIASAFNGATGHSHDGSTGNAPKINLATSLTGYLPAVHGGTGGKNNFSATTNPAATDDAGDGYAPGSMWENTTTGRIFICVGNTANAAVWRELVQIETSNVIKPISHDGIDLGTPTVRFQDLYLSGGIGASGNVSLGGTLNVTGATTLTGAATANGGLTVNGTTALSGSVTIGDPLSSLDTISVGAGFTSNLVPSTNAGVSLGTSSTQWNNLYIDGTATIDTLTVDENTTVAGTLGVTGTSTLSTANITNITATGTINLAGATVSNLGTVTTAAIGGGSLNNVVIGGSTPAAITGTTITGTSLVGPLTGNVTGNVTGNLTGNVTGNVTGNLTGNVTATSGTSNFTNVTISGQLNMDATSAATITNLTAPSNDLDAATKLYVDTAVSNLVDSAPDSLNTLNELAAAINDDASAYNTLNTAIGNKLPKAGGTMSGAINMGGQKITNAADPTAAQDLATKNYIDTTYIDYSSAADAANDAEKLAVNAEDVQYTLSDGSTTGYSALHYAAKAAASYDSFDDRYLGSKASDPTLDNDNNALITGALYFDSTNGVMKVYNGTEWANASSSIEGIKSNFYYTATSGQTAFSGSDDNSNTLVIDKAGLVNVYMNGVRLHEDDYTVSAAGDSVTLAAGAATGDLIYLEVFGNFAGQSGADVAITGGSITGLTSLGVNGDITLPAGAKIKYNDDRYFTPENNVDGAEISANGIFKVKTGATPTERFRVDASGNFGIGITNPANYDWSNTIDLVVGNTSGSSGLSIVSSTSGGGNIAFADGTTGNERYRGYIYYDHASDYMSLWTSGTEAARFDSSGNFLVGHTAENTWTDNNSAILRESGVATFTATSTTPLYANRRSSNGDLIQFRRDGVAIGSIGSHAGDYLTIGEGASGLIFNVSTASVRPWNMDNTTSPDGVVNLGSSNGRFKDLYLSNAAYIGSYGSITQGAGGDLFIRNTYASGDLVINSGRRTIFQDEGTERMRVESDGSLLIASTDTDPYDNSSSTGGGIALRETGAIYNAVYQGTPVVSNRIGNDGNILQVRRDGVKIGAIGSSTKSGDTNIYVGSGDVGMYYHDANDSVDPVNPANGFDRDGAIDLGRSGVRFKDLYLSGGVYLGGTGSANKLDDYEEGTWSPTITGNSGAFSQTYTQQSGRYTKIGNYVYLTYDVDLSDAGSPQGTYMVLGGLPFTAATGNHGGSLMVAYHTGWQSLANDHIGGYISGNNAYLVNGSNDYIRISDGNHTSSSRLIGSAWFVTS